MITIFSFDHMTDENQEYILFTSNTTSKNHFAVVQFCSKFLKALNSCSEKVNGFKQ